MTKLTKEQLEYEFHPPFFFCRNQGKVVGTIEKVKGEYQVIDETCHLDGKPVTSPKDANAFARDMGWITSAQTTTLKAKIEDSK